MKIIGPLLSNTAHGSFANTLTFSKRKTHQHARIKQGSNKKLTPLQAEWRLLMDYVSLKWQSLSQVQKEAFSILGKEQSPIITGYQYFAKVSMRSPKDYLDLISFWPLMAKDSSGNLKDYSGNNYDLTEWGDVVDKFSTLTNDNKKLRYSFMKNDPSSHFRTNHSKQFDLSWNDFSISFFMDNINYTSWRVLFELRAATPLLNGIYFQWTGTSIHLMVWFNSVEQSSYMKFRNSTNDQRLFITFSSLSDSSYMFVNGVQMSSHVFTEFGMNIFHSPKVVGHSPSASLSPYSLNAVSIMNRGISLEEHTFLYKSLKLKEGYAKK